MADDLTVIFALLGSTFVNTAHKTLMKLTQELGLILPMFYEQLLHKQIPKAQKDTDDLTVFFFCFWDL